MSVVRLRKYLASFPHHGHRPQRLPWLLKLKAVTVTVGNLTVVYRDTGIHTSAKKHECQILQFLKLPQDASSKK